jgi:hypothetical protein
MDASWRYPRSEAYQWQFWIGHNVPPWRAFRAG